MKIGNYQTDDVLEIFRQLASVRNKKQLWTVINDVLQPFFQFETAVISLATNDNRLYVLDEQAITTSEDPLLLEPLLRVYYDAKHPIFQEIFESNEPIRLDIKERLHEYPETEWLKIMSDVGITHSLCIRLKIEDRIIGTFSIHKSDPFDPALVKLFQTIGEQLASVISNIQINEEVLLRQAEKDLLLNIAESIAAARDFNELIDTINDLLDPIFGDGVISSIYLIHNSNKLRLITMSYEMFHHEPLEYFEITGTPFEGLLRNEALCIQHLDPIRKQFPEYWGNLFTSPEIKELMFAPLRIKGTVIGSMSLATKGSYYETRLQLFQAISDQVSVAVSNILVNEEILKRDEEKAILLDISQTISSIKDVKDVYQLLFQKLKPIFHFDDFPTVITYDHQYYQVFLTGFGNEIISGTIAPHIPAKQFIKGSAFEEVVERKEPYVRILSEALEKYPNEIAIKEAIKLGLEEVLVAPLCFQGKIIGSLHLHSRSADRFVSANLTLLKEIADRLAVSISNLIANNEILSGRKEKELQADLAESITKEKSWKDRFIKVAETFEHAIPFDLIQFEIHQEDTMDRRFSFEKVDESSYDPRVDFDSVKSKGLFQWNKLEHKPQIFDTEHFNELMGQNSYLKDVVSTIELKSCLLVPIALTKKDVFVVSFFSKGVDTYHADSIEVSSKLATALLHPLEKMLAFEKIEKLNFQLEQEKSYLLEEMNSSLYLEEMIGSSRPMEKVQNKVSEVSKLDTTVLIEGETGTGKELVARAIHNSSNRNDKILVKVNCAALPADLIESELFGHEKGSFTGAIKQRIGKFELADQGTIFLDEIGELSQEMQAKLLRVLQEKEIERVGSSKTIKVDFRVIAATNRNLTEEVKNGSFRKDLYYRLHIFPINVPPLRDREDDVIELADYFGKKYCQKIGSTYKGFTDSTIALFRSYRWPGNVRELQNIVEQAIINQRNKVIELTSLTIENGGDKDLDDLPIDEEITLETIKTKQEALERKYLEMVLAKTKWRIRGKNGAAKLLNVNPTTLEYRLKKLGLS